MIGTTLTLEAVPLLEQRVSPELLAFAGLLSLPAGELESVVEHELEQNPALERLESLVCPVCGEPGPPCACRLRSRRSAQATADAMDFIDGAIADEPTPAQALLAELMPLVASLDRPILEYLVGSLDERGMLEPTAEEVGSQLVVSPERVRSVLAVLQQHGPAGVGAADLRECLLLQLDRLPTGGVAHALARRIIEEHLHLLAAGRWRALATALGVTREEVARAAEFIRARLRPHASLDVPLVRSTAPPALPDVIVRQRADDAGFSVEVVEPQRVRLVVAPAYERLALDTLERGARQRVRAQVGMAHSFLHRLQRRWETMLAVAEATVARQGDYVRRGPRFLKPLTRADVAAAIGIHESTVSRATSGRFVALPSGRVVPFGRFFEPSQAPCAALAELVAQEVHPRSDNALALELGRLGYPLARRTVAKYRERLGIPPHTER